MFRKLFVAAALLSAGPLSAQTLGDDGLHKAEWMRDTFLDLREDLEEANAEGLRLMVMVEQRGCIYCTELHERVLVDPEIEAFIRDHYFVVQLNMFGDREVTDFDGTTMSEKNMIQDWGLFFTPTILFYPPDVPEDLRGQQAAAVVMPGAFGRSTVLNLLTWVAEEGYLGDEVFQKYHARMIEEQGLVED
ncbi:SoxW family protein [Flavimaricola marinus]|uniref:Thioredoxin-like fold domain-containing protein n=1 Tax=Flavimaricola marinus TaxID=1819565 RepID=A0A238LGY8_9RHOB|nr:thioredoxin family protein [Flavimaricola marinus]SMY08911.1 hypothetical protein LOM8899_03070 [Flavimaricola marinus]